jgi:hypothetical protein
MAVLEVSTAANQVFSAFSFIGFVLVTIPLPWHLEGQFSFDNKFSAAV